MVYMMNETTKAKVMKPVYEAFDLDIALTVYMDKIREDYRSRFGNDTGSISDFDVTIYRGSKYLKVVAGGRHKSVHSFIVIKPDNKFKFGDILMAASWAAPARNFSRGNVLNIENQSVRWTGV
jgi:hypothetical protein